MKKNLPPVRIAHTYVEVRPDLLDGSPCIRGTRVPVRRLWHWHQRGVSVETLVKRYPQLGAARVLSALAFAYDNVDLIEADLAYERSLLDHEPLTSAADRTVPLPFPGGKKA